jgi:ABC-type antimicrobial peptide transport system permease subunit
MVDIARKNLFHDKTRLAITVVGITFSVVLIFAQFGLYLGFMRNASIIIDNTEPTFGSRRRTRPTSTSRCTSARPRSTR